MGCMPSKVDAGDQDARKRNAKIERIIRDDKKTEARTIKIFGLIGEENQTKPNNATPSPSLPKRLLLRQTLSPPIKSRCILETALIEL
jgi:hypothetical protein